ncbi:Ribosome biogenesis protein ytm1 [Endocarpon pusillum Z07020]|uniref:Ribosome biogenesis protein YTM1 n=1 Tax=Endocarpon pusillum (strain Z07020 / HMAS-L-300199) TaxID=1263415 RepID=U1I1P2_ENDPU|nr:Ribosome biogenesis protein ytm1 [Endocarpon pusillum Z07020]ERF77175.1 Ribosome biogenesis protein ytm1 [Endocarpon pusillum Z07020]
MAETGGLQTQVRLQLTTRDRKLALPESLGPILVPSSLRRYALSTLVNNLLGTEKPIPLEFLINGSYLRTSVDDYLTANGFSTETTLAVEYVRALIPPTHVASFEHDDWVSSVDVLSLSPSNARGDEMRIWNTSSQVLATSPSPSDGGHTSSVTSSKFLSPTKLVSSGLDRTVRVWNYRADGAEASGKVAPQLELYGHRGSVNSIAVHGHTNRILSASADHNVGVWSTSKSQAPEAPSNLLPSASARGSKRRKLDQSVTVPQRGPLSLLKAHTEAVSEAVFDSKDSTVGYSASWDHTVRTWDLVTSALVDTRTTSNALLSLTQLPELHLLAAGSSGKDVKLIDPRDTATTVSAMTLRGHYNAVVSLAKDPESEYGIISGSHDGTCRVWDVRSKRSGKDGMVGESIYTIERESAKGKGRIVAGEGVKVFGVCWDKALGIVSASEDKRVQINRGSGIVSQRSQTTA